MPVLELTVCEATCAAEVGAVEVTMAAPSEELGVAEPWGAFAAPACACRLANKFCMKVLKLCATAGSKLLGARTAEV